MKIRQFMAVGLALAFAGSAQAVTVLSEGFGSVATLSAAGWTQVNNSVAPVPAGNSWFQGNTGIFPAAAGAADSYAAANFLSTSATTGAISSWLILPTLTLDSTSVVSFMVRNAGEGFLDKLEVRFSPNGASSNVGATTTSVGDFTVLLGSYASAVAGNWSVASYSLASLATPTSGRLAIRYVVDDVATAGNYIGVDSLTVTAVPEPSSCALLGAGLAALVLRRRFAA